MKTYFTASAIAISLLFTACGENSEKSKTVITNKNTVANPSESDNATPQNSVATQDIITGYLTLKNALANDKGKEAADASEKIVTSLEKLNEDAFTPAQKKLFNDVKEDMKEHAEHIADNSNNISHQREHFDIMSQDLIDLVESAGTNQTLYKVYCPMYNNNKGAFWLSESKEIKNPYLGQKMPTCGEIKAEIKAKG